MSRRPIGELTLFDELRGVATKICSLEPFSLVTVEGGFPAFGVGSEICAQIVESEAFDYLDAPVERITGADLPTPVSPASRILALVIVYSHLSLSQYANSLEDLAFPDVPLIVKVIRRSLS